MLLWTIYFYFTLLYCRWKGLCENFLKNLNNHCLPENSRSPNPIYTAYFYTFCLRNRRSELCYTFSDQRQLFFLVTRRKLLHRDDDGNLAYSSLNISSYPVRTRVGHSVLLRSERYDLSRSKKRTLRSFTFFSRVFGDLWDPKERYVLFRSFEKNGKERKERNVLLQRTEKNAKNVTFFCKERERTWERFVLLQMNLERNVLCYVLFSRYI